MEWSWGFPQALSLLAMLIELAGREPRLEGVLAGAPFAVEHVFSFAICPHSRVSDRWLPIGRSAATDRRRALFIF
jgi:hypothetical protein